MQLRLTLQAKFPEAPEDDILKVVGNLLYYRYMNPAIVAPDGFGIVETGVDKQLTPDQRRNLGSIAKVLQHAAANKLVSDFLHSKKGRGQLGAGQWEVVMNYNGACETQLPRCACRRVHGKIGKECMWMSKHLAVVLISNTGAHVYLSRLSTVLVHAPVEQ